MAILGCRGHRVGRLKVESIYIYMRSNATPFLPSIRVQI